MPARGRLLDERADDVVRVVGVADGVGAAHQHLEHDVGDLAAQLVEPHPRILRQESVGDVERGAAPVLDREQLGADVGGRRRDARQVVAAQPRRQQRLVRVAPGGVGQPHAAILAQHAHDPLGTALLQHLLGAGRRRDARHGRRRRLRRQHGQRRLGLAAHGRVAVDDGRADVAQDARRAIAARRVLEQLGRLVDQRRVRLAVGECRVRQDVFEEREVGLDAADAELAQRAHSLAPHVVPLETAGRDLDQQRIVVLRHARADVARAVVQADAVADRRPVDLDLARVGQEAVARVLGGDAHLDGDAALLDLRLTADADLGIGQAITLGDAQLRLHQVTPRDRLGHRVLDLDARVDLDEVVGAVLGDQELDGARVGVADVTRDLQRVVSQARAQRLGQRPRGRVFDDLLVPALHRAVALVQVDDVAVVVAQDLHLDVLGALDQLLEEDRIVAERLARLGARALQQLGELGRGAHDAHAATAAAARGLDDHGEANLVRERARVVDAAHRILRPRHDGHARRGRDLARLDLVAQRLDHLGRRADEDDAGFAALARERGALRQQTVAGVDGVDIVALGQLDDLVFGQVSGHRLQALAHQVGFIRLVAVQVDAILLGEDGDRAEAELGAGAEDTHRDLATVGGKYATKWGNGHGRACETYHFGHRAGKHAGTAASRQPADGRPQSRMSCLAPRLARCANGLAVQRVPLAIQQQGALEHGLQLAQVAVPLMLLQRHDGVAPQLHGARAFGG